MAIAKLKSKIVISPLIICPNWLIQVDGGFLLANVVMIRMMLMTIYVLVRALKPFLSLVIQVAIVVILRMMLMTMLVTMYVLVRAP